MAEIARRAVQQRLQSCRRRRIERGMDGVRARGAGDQRRGAVLGEGVDGVADGLLAAPHGSGDGGDPVTAGTGTDDLAAAYGESVRGAQASRQGLLLQFGAGGSDSGATVDVESRPEQSIRPLIALGGLG